MPLLPLEFVDCLSDSPYFRENLHAHEKELESTSSQIKVLIKQVNQLLEAAKGRLTYTCCPCLLIHLLFAVLSRAQRNLANTLSNFTFEVIGNERTDDEIVIGKGKLTRYFRPQINALFPRIFSWLTQGIRPFAQCN